MSAPQSQVVQDFVQMTEDEETPQEWLHRIMDTSSREGSDYDINLLGKTKSIGKTDDAQSNTIERLYFHVHQTLLLVFTSLSLQPSSLLNEKNRVCVYVSVLDRKKGGEGERERWRESEEEKKRKS